MSKNTNAMTVGTWSWSVDDDFCYADEVTSGLFSIDPDEAARGLPVSRYLSAICTEDRPAVERQIAAAVSKSGTFFAEYSVVSLFGKRKILASGQCFRVSRRGLMLSGHVIDATCFDGHSDLLQQIDDWLAQALNGAARARLPMLRYLIQMAYLELHGSDVAGAMPNAQGSARRH